MNKNHSDEEISIPELIFKTQKYFRYLRQRRLVILLWILSFFIIGVIYAITRDEEYEAVNVVLSYSGSGNMLNNQAASRLAGLAGIPLPGGQQQDGRVISELMIPSLLTTYPVASKLGSMPLRFFSEDTVMTGVGYFEQEPEKTVFDHIKYWTIQVPIRIIRWVVVKVSPEPTKIRPPETTTSPSDTTNVRIVTSEPSSAQRGSPVIETFNHLFVDQRRDYALSQLTSRIEVEIESNKIIIKTTMPDAYAAADLAQHATNILMQEVVNFEVRKTEEELAFLMELYKESETKYNKALKDASELTDRLRGTTSTASQILLTRAAGDSEIARQQFTQITLRVEEARIKLKEDTPMFAVMNPIQIPQNPKRSNPIGLVIIFTFLGFFGGIGWVTVRGMYDAMKEVASEDETA